MTIISLIIGRGRSVRKGEEWNFV